MKLHYSRLLPCAFLFVLVMLTYQASAQTDYIIKKDGVKVMGDVKSYSINKVKFIPVGETKALKYDPDQVNEIFSTKDGIFRSVLLNKDQHRTFLQVLEDGRIKLYRYIVSSGAPGAPMFNGGGFSGMGVGYSHTKLSWYAQKDGSALIEVKSNSIWGSRKGRKDAFLALIADNEQVTQRYQAEDKFTFDFVRSLVEDYNKL